MIGRNGITFEVGDTVIMFPTGISALVIGEGDSQGPEVKNLDENGTFGPWLSTWQSIEKVLQKGKKPEAISSSITLTTRRRLITEATITNAEGKVLASGQATLSPNDPDIPEVGESLAAGRAFRKFLEDYELEVKEGEEDAAPAPNPIIPDSFFRQTPSLLMLLGPQSAPDYSAGSLQVGDTVFHKLTGKEGVVISTKGESSGRQNLPLVRYQDGSEATAWGFNLVKNGNSPYKLDKSGTPLFVGDRVRHKDGDEGKIFDIGPNYIHVSWETGHDAGRKIPTIAGNCIKL